MTPAVDFKAQYLSWIQEQTEMLPLTSGTVRLTAPFLDADNDYIEIYIVNNGDKLRLTDAGETISNLELSNFRMSDKRRSVLKTIVASNGVTLGEDNSIFTECTPQTFAPKANSLMQCMIKVSDMLMLSESNIKTFFAEDVKAFFDENSIIYTQNVSFIGKSSFYATYDFVLPKTKKHPERFIVPINYPKENIIKTTIFTWEDVKGSRDRDCELYAILNDSEKSISASSVDALQRYGIQCLPWSKRNDVLDLLSA